MYASSNQKCKREPPKAGHLLFISSLKELAVGHFYWAENGGTGRYQVITGRLTPCVRCSGVGHVSYFESHALVSNGYLRTTGRYQVGTGLKHRGVCKPQPHRTQSTRRVRCSPDLSAESVAKCPHTGRTPPDAPRASDALREIPPASVRPHRTHEQGTPCVWCSMSGAPP